MQWLYVKFYNASPRSYKAQAIDILSIKTQSTTKHPDPNLPFLSIEAMVNKDLFTGVKTLW